MAEIDQFKKGPYLYDLEGLKDDMLGKILEEHKGEENAISHLELCHYYFDPHPFGLEEKYLISNILQGCRGVLQAGGYFLNWGKGKGWFACRTVGEAFDHVLGYAKREVRLHHRLQGKAHIAIGDRYQLPVSNPLIKAIHGTTPSIKRLEKAIDKPKLPKPKEGSSK